MRNGKDEHIITHIIEEDVGRGISQKNYFDRVGATRHFVHLDEANWRKHVVHNVRHIAII